MRLRTKFNLALLVVFMGSLAVTGWISYEMLRKNARDSVLRNADVMMEAAMSMRTYTVEQIKPLLEMQLRRAFLPQSIPAYSATELFNALRTKYADFTYKEATLNPTNPRDRATDWESDLVYEFRNHPDKTQIIGERMTPTGRSLYYARPIKIKDENCLVCHSTPEAAPETMIKLYGEANGFGWKHNEIVGTQIVSVPMAIPNQRATATFYTFMSFVVGIFVLLFILLNLMLHYVVVRPLAKISHLSDEISKGNWNLPEFRMEGKDEVAVVAQAFNRLRRSTEKAMKMMEDQLWGPMR